MKERISPERILFMAGTVLVSLAGAIFLCFRHIEQQKVFFCLVIVALIMVLCALLLAVYDRRREKEYFFGTDYSKIFLMNALAWAVAVGGSFLPGFFFPVGLLVFILAGVMETTSAVALSVLISALIYVSSGDPGGVFLSYAILAVYTGLISDFMKKSRMQGRIMAVILIIPVSVLVPSLFYFDTYDEISILQIAGAFGVATVVSLYAALLYPLIHGWLGREKRSLYDTILDEEHPLQLEYKAYSLKEYTRALEICVLSKLCAKEIGVDINLASAGGLYYNLGKIYGDPELDNALAAAYKYRFPRELMTLMREHGQDGYKPTSQEAAIVHMVDSLYRRIDEMREETDSIETEWNQEMVVYRILNDLSQSDLYDESGLTLNQFLKIRKCLVREGKLI